MGVEIAIALIVILVVFAVAAFLGRIVNMRRSHAYRRTITDWKATAPTKEGASVTPGRASQRPSKGKAARQTTSP